MSSPGAYERIDANVVADADMVGVLETLAGCSQIGFTSQVDLVDPADNSRLEDLTGFLLKRVTTPTVSRDCTAEVAGKATLSLSQELAWGRDQIAPSLLISSPEYESGQWQAFPVGVYVCTSPGRDNLDAYGVFSLTGYDRCYLLQTDAEDAFSFAGGTTYLASVTAIMRAAGLLAPTAALSTIVNYPGAWATKTRPAADTYPLDGAQTYLQILNAELAASGCSQFYTDRHGGFAIDLIPTPASQPLLWRWFGGRYVLTDGTFADPDGADFDMRIVQYAKQQYQGDVWNLANRWRFIQSGLTFIPTHTDGSDGMYVVDNINDPPGDQNSLGGRIICDTQTLTASGAADLIKQGDKYVTAAKSQAEKVNLASTPWPAGWHYDVFQYTHPQLPFTALRRVQAQAWTLPLDGSVMTWNTNVVGKS